MKATYRVLAYLIAGCVVLQATWIGLGTFTMINEVDGGLIVDKDYEVNAFQGLHGTFGVMIIPALALLLLIVSFFAKVHGGIKWALIVLALVVLQVTFAFVAFGLPAIGALHGINAFALLGCAAIAGRRVDTSAAAGTPASDQTAAPGATV